MPWNPSKDDIGFGDKVRKYTSKIKEDFGNVYLLDVGCGHANHLLDYSQSADYTIGIELAEAKDELYKDNIDKARSNVKQSGRKDIAIIQADANAMPLRDCSVNFVTNKDTPQNGIILSETYRVLKPNGYYIKSGRGNSPEVLKAILEVITDRDRQRFDKQIEQIERRSHGLISYINEIKDTGFEILEAEEIPVTEKPKSRGDVVKILKWPSILGDNFDPEKDQRYIDALVERLENENDGIFYKSLIVARKIK